MIRAKIAKIVVLLTTGTNYRTMSFDFFRRSLYLYWTLLIFYSSVVLISIYCYQFSLVPTYWRRITYLDKQWNHDIGLINYKEEGDSGYLLSDIFSHIWAYLPYISLLMLKFFILYHRNSSIFQCPFYSAVKSNFILLHNYAADEVFP